MVPKSGHVTIKKIENLHIDSRRKIHWFQKCCSLRSTTKINEVIAEKTFPNSGITMQALDAWPSWIDAHRQYMFLWLVLVLLHFS